jgi:hypothetical protein
MQSRRLIARLGRAGDRSPCALAAPGRCTSPGKGVEYRGRAFLAFRFRHVCAIFCVVACPLSSLVSLCLVRLPVLAAAVDRWSWRILGPSVDRGTICEADGRSTCSKLLPTLMMTRTQKTFSSLRSSASSIGWLHGKLLQIRRRLRMSNLMGWAIGSRFCIRSPLYTIRDSSLACASILPGLGNADAILSLGCLSISPMACPTGLITTLEIDSPVGPGKGRAWF